MSIQNSINQTLGATAIAAKLSPQLQELGEKIRTNTAIGKTEKQLKDVALSGQTEYNEEEDKYVNILDDAQYERFLAFAAQKRALDQKAVALGLKTTDWKEFGPDVITMDEAQELDARGLLQRNKIDALKKTKEIMRDYQFGGKYYGSDK